jgi:alkanesulfonate monooxygenase SsuD/methylene tetrahydromethanopterin reductase-like flavin-dependent oxidoreductase (luciferase family)
MIGVLIGRDDAEVERRADDLLRQVGRAGDRDWFAGRRGGWIAGTPDQALEAVARYEAVGVERVMLQSMIPRDLDMIDLAAEVLIRG